MKYIFDTNICIFSIRGKYEIDKIIRKIGIDKISISEITVFELYYGAENSANPKKHYQLVQDFIAPFSILPIFSTSKTYARIKSDLRKKGKLIHDEFDLLIAASAIANDLILVSDIVKHFQNIENLKIENWIER